jgi:hypothetical protein
MRGGGCYGAVVLIVVLGACTHGASGASSTTSTTRASTTSPRPEPTTMPPTTTSTQPPAPPATAAPPTPAPDRCHSSDLTLTAGPVNGAAGTQYFLIGFRNHSAFACELTGYPGVSFLDASGNQIGLPARRNNVAYAPVTIAPSVKVYAQVGVGNPGVFNCAGVTPHDIRVFPPNETAAILVHPPDTLLVCPTQGAPLVGPVEPTPP